MTTVKSKNVFNIAVKGTFDDCQNIVKKLFIDENLNSQLRLGSINSINWTRIMAQISYYIFSYNKVKEEYKNKKVSFCVPTGNFGDAFAGYIAREKFNVPINKIIIATNKNNILDRFFKTGIYKKEKVYQTMSPSMDIQIASNFERLLYDLYNQNGNIINDLMNDFSKNGIIKVNNKSFKKTKKIFLSFSINEKETMNSILHAYKKNQIIVDPHTAVGLEASRKFIKKNKNDIVITLATAHASKFSKAVSTVLGFNPDFPQNYKNIFKLNEKFIILENSYEQIKNYIVKNT